MNFILNIEKPIGISSHDAVHHIRKHLKIQKVGHAGTLDVEASGVLVVGVGEGTKLLHHLQHHHKVYRFDVAFGRLTDTLDHTGQVTEIKNVPLPTWLDLQSIIGPYQQVPPAYSAVKVKGKKLYQYARLQEAIPDVPARTLTIFELTQLTPCQDFEDQIKATFEVKASSGLYVRKLALDIAQIYATVAHTTRIFRTAVGPFSIAAATPLKDITIDDGIPLTEAIPDYPPYILNNDELNDVKVGKSLRLPLNHPKIQVIDSAKRLWGLYQKKEEMYLPLRIFKGV